MDPSMFDGTLVKSNRIIYTPSDFAKANLIHLQEAGELRAQKPHTSRRQNLSSYLFFMVLEGEGTLEYGGETYALRQGDCVYVDCRSTYAHSCSETLWHLKWVHFYGPNMGGIYGKYVERGGKPILTPPDGARYEHLLDEIYEIAVSNTYIKDMQIFEKLTSLLTLLMEQSWSAQEAGHENGKNARKHFEKRQNLQEVKEFLDAHYASKITLDMLAERFFINKFYLTRIFKEQFGESVTGYLLQVRITQAKQKLRFTDKPIEEIAHECGMNDANYFSRMFKKVEGVTPGEFRRMW
jgi:AraC-like DNA-binding protein